MLSLNAGRRGWVLPHLNVPDFVDSPWEKWMGRAGGEAGVGEKEKDGWRPVDEM